MSEPSFYPLCQSGTSHTEQRDTARNQPEFRAVARRGFKSQNRKEQPAEKAEITNKHDSAEAKLQKRRRAGEVERPFFVWFTAVIASRAKKKNGSKGAMQAPPKSNNIKSLST